MLNLNKARNKETSGGAKALSGSVLGRVVLKDVNVKPAKRGRLMFIHTDRGTKKIRIPE
ncbi:hypothetical protein [Alicyclobacillus macrosporangiidus]|uniref:Uncharacterized protein n=1 Tax=Alicyclobacillus macrosporangiidus TaxID=392015 RepID=A0A1I7HDI6_9BACL|nr:hypothetical protein [Alicyclobacillus macrosporangiidus]MCL6599927.1 hypothetical protein [Alicyclobacillus macrosporangiidus]SFU58682.1 hypothetical protein SAMN05421543_104128 [Alicyclobacillus macrosporangiidus]